MFILITGDRLTSSILLIGASGQLGHEFLDALTGSLVLSPSSQELDASSPDSVRRYLDAHRDIRAIINCAAATDVDRLEDEHDRAFRLNAIAAENIAVMARELNAPLIHFSTDYVFDGHKKTPYMETDQTNPMSVYGASKLEGEKRVLATAPTCLCIRVSWLFSPYGKNFVKTILALSQQRDELSVVGDQTGSPSYARDIAHHVTDILPRIKPGTQEIYHLTNAGQASWFEIAEASVKRSGSGCKVKQIETKDYPTKAHRPPYSVLDTGKIERDFGIQLRRWEEALAECLDILDR